MTEHHPTPPSWIVKRNGQLVPFEADKISRALFAATETIGQPDAFVARELTDAVLHFLASECADTPPSTAQVAELVVKVVRELGHPALAQAFADFARRRQPAETPPAPLGTSRTAPFLEQLTRWVEADADPLALAWRTASAVMSEYSLRTVFARDLAAAHADGLLRLGGLEAPLELAGCVLDSPAPTGSWLEAIEQARARAGIFLAIDAPEHTLAALPGSEAVASFLGELRLALKATGLRAVVNLNCALPPSWADDLAPGPLFAGQRQAPTAADLARLADALLDGLAGSGGSIRIDWHLAERDLGAEGEGRLLRVVRRVAEGAPIALVFDRPRRPVPLAEGIDRRQPAALMLVGVDLCRLAEQPGVGADPVRFLNKLGSLTRLALSAGAQKRDFLRRHGRGRPGLTRGFLLDRARLVVVPIGLERLARSLIGQDICSGGEGLEFARKVLHRLRDALCEDGRHRLLETCLDSAPGFTLDDAPPGPPVMRRAAGVTAWDAAAPPRHQVWAAGLLHAGADTGTAAILLGETGISPEEIVALLRQVWEQSDVVRLCFVRLPHETPPYTASAASLPLSEPRS